MSAPMPEPMSQVTHLSKIIAERRSVFPKQYTGGEIAQEFIKQVLENGNWAPSHKKTEPWRFKVVRGKALDRLGAYLAARYKDLAGANFNEAKYTKTLINPTKSAVVIGICMQRDPQERLPEWEEIAAVACAVQNMMLTCSAAGIGCYWSSPKTITHDKDFFNLEDGERCLGLLYMGNWAQKEMKIKRGPVEDKTVWINE